MSLETEEHTLETEAKEAEAEAEETAEESNMLVLAILMSLKK